ncbi:MAG: hypothetical protein RL015_1957 [Verrucomicrobiota bacterium]|jgi:hypothetical protein
MVVILSNGWWLYERGYSCGMYDRDVCSRSGSVFHRMDASWLVYSVSPQLCPTLLLRSLE